MLCSSQGNTNRIRTKEWLKLGFLRWFSAALQSLSKQGQQQVDQDCVWLDLRLSMDGDFTACLGRLCQYSTILMGKKCFPLFRWGFRFFSSCPCALILPFVGLDPVITYLFCTDDPRNRCSTLMCLTRAEHKDHLHCPAGNIPVYDDQKALGLFCCKSAQLD